MPLEYDTDYPISTLNHNNLYRIFSLNANDHEYLRYPKGAFSPLTITRRCSQVCMLWRDIIVGAASIWGSCIELNMLAQRRSDWRDEVLRRTSGARLSIYVHRVNAIHQSGIMHTLLVDLLQNHWERIRVLNIAVTSPEDIRDPRILNALGRPAPVLEEFLIQCSEEVTELSVTGGVSQGFHLFSNDARL
ncbi:hypothetical protein BDN70DRAFT_936072 [Pholiota conissans]|uniref:Uncharacterized protein n=1 Tax=Pholiota conissans TaxID=109636 RepID=A0A9P5YWI2_9AGAR|nr:hypothetical protein BDN70DRAFT_936072 [Pholiota conissans]